MRLVVHIGCGKGGSSAIQAFLRDNADSLSGRGIYVPTSDLTIDGHRSGNQIDLFRTLMDLDREQATSALRRRLTALRNNYALDHDTIVISAENLCNPVGHEELFAPLRDEFDIAILFYVRRQDDYLASAWQQWYVKEGRSLLAWLTENVGDVANWYQYIERWAQVFDVEDITIRPYAREAFPEGSIELDFAGVLRPGIDVSSFEISSGDVNTSLNTNVSRWVEGRGTALFSDNHDNNFYSFLYRLGGREVRDPAGSLFDVHERTAIMRRYAWSNEALRSKYLPAHPKPLFPLPRPKPETARPDRDQRLDSLEYIVYRMWDDLRHRGVLE